MARISQAELPCCWRPLATLALRRCLEGRTATSTGEQAQLCLPLPILGSVAALHCLQPRKLDAWTLEGSVLIPNWTQIRLEQS